MRILALVTILAPLASPTCEAPPPPTARPDAAPVPGPYGLEDRVCFALAERCGTPCDEVRFDALAVLDGTLTAESLGALDRCFTIPACGPFDACAAEWLRDVRR